MNIRRPNKKRVPKEWQVLEGERLTVVEEEHEYQETWQWTADRLEGLSAKHFVVTKSRITNSHLGELPPKEPAPPAPGEPMSQKIWASVVVSGFAFVVFSVLSLKAVDFVAQAATSPEGSVQAANSLVKVLAAVASGIGACAVGVFFNRYEKGKRR